MCAVRNEAKAAPPFTYFTDLKNPLLLEQFEKRGWQTIPRWDLFWTNILSPKISASYRRIGAFRIGRNQKINHFPRSEQLCRKDLLVKNLHSYVERSHCRLRDIDFLPATYRLPSEYAAFEADYRANAASIWIMKPLDKCQGKGIYLVHQLPEVRRRLQEAQYESSDYLISRYIERPLLIGGRKFDLRLFVLVTSFRPLRAYLYNDGFCRVCSERYTNHFDTLQNRYVHLTNVRVQQSSPKYNGLHGGKWSLRQVEMKKSGREAFQIAYKSFIDQFIDAGGCNCTWTGRAAMRCVASCSAAFQR